MINGATLDAFATVGQPLAAVVALAVIANGTLALIRDWRGGSPELRLLRTAWTDTRDDYRDIAVQLRELVTEMRNR